MKKYSLLYTALGLIAILAVLNSIAITLHLYWTTWWYDLMMHLLAGFSGGLAALWFLKSWGTVRSIFLTIAAVMVVGIAYEIFEYIYGIIPPGNYWQDTSIDLVLDGVGAVLACLYANRGQHLAVRPPSARI